MAEAGLGTLEYVALSAVAALIVIGLVVGIKTGAAAAIAQDAICRVRTAVDAGTCTPPVAAPVVDQPADNRPTNEPGNGAGGGGDHEPDDLRLDPSDRTGPFAEGSESQAQPQESPVCTPSGVSGMGSTALTVGGELTLANQPVQVTAGATYEVGDALVDENGVAWQTFETEFTLQQSASTENFLKGMNKTGAADDLVGIDQPKSGKGGPNLDYEVYTSAKARQTVTVPAGQDISAGVPNIVQPLAMAEGVSVSMGSGVYAGYNVEAEWRAFLASINQEQGVETSMAVTRMEGDTVRVSIGAADLISQASAFGLGAEGLSVQLASSFEQSDYQLNQFDFDLSDPAAQQAYYRLVLAGQEPPEQTVKESAVITGERAESKKGWKIDLAAISLELGVSESALDISEQVNDDGTSTVNVVSDRNGQTRVYTAQLDSAGEVVDEDFQLRIQNASPEQVAFYNDKYARVTDPERPSGAQNMVLSWDADDMANFRHEALERAAVRFTRDRDGAYSTFFPDAAIAGRPVTGADVEAWLTKTPQGDAELALQVAFGNSTDVKNVLLEIGEDPDSNWGTFAGLTNGLRPGDEAYLLGAWAVDVSDIAQLPYNGRGTMLCTTVVED